MCLMLSDIENVYICASALRRILIAKLLYLSRVCVCLFVVFCHQVHIDPEIYVGTYVHVHHDMEKLL